MNIFWFLKQRLEFIDRLYGEATTSFRERMRKMEAGEPPYEDHRDPEHDDISEPAFLEEWQDANEAVEVLGHWCLNMVHASLKAFLEQYIDEMASGYRREFSDAKEQLAKTKAPNWFDRHRLFFLNYFRIDWERGPVKVSDLEQINLTRDDLTHNINVTTYAVYQTKKHAERYPKGIFTDELWANIGLKGKIKVDRDQLANALNLVDAFCGWLEKVRANYGAYMNSLTELDSTEPSAARSRFVPH